MIDLTYTIEGNNVRFAAVSPKGWGKCSEMARYISSTGPFLADQLPAIVNQLESEGYTIAAVEWDNRSVA